MFAAAAAIGIAALAPVSVSASSGPVMATMTATGAASGTSITDAVGLRVTIARSGIVAFDAALRPCRFGCAADDPTAARFAELKLQDLDGDGEPEVLLDLFWAGAHCCWYTQIYRYVDGRARYRTNVHIWGNFSYVLADLEHDGRQELVTRDNRFSYAFSSFADSRWPVRILRYRQGGMTIVTRQYASEIRRDATALWHEAMGREKTRSNQGVIAAWAADQCMLGRCTQAFTTIDRLSRTGRIHGERTRVAYERRLRAFLARTGYR